MEKNDFEKSADTVMELYRRMGSLDGLSEEEIAQMREREVRRAEKIRKKLEEQEKEKQK